MNRIVTTTAAIIFFIGGGAPALAGHGVSHYPSYYPDEIRVDVIDPATAARRLVDKTLHAYVGATPSFGGRVPQHVKPVESLGSIMVLGFNPASKAFATDERRCASAAAILARLRERSPGVVVHPYPVTPYHADYLHHLDRIDAAHAAAAPAAAVPALKFRAVGERAKALVRPPWTLASEDWEVSLEEVPVARLLAEVGVRLDGRRWLPLAKEGWFQAYRLLRDSVTDAEHGQAIDALYRRLNTGEYLDFAEQVNLERGLVDALTRGCQRLVVGYALRREYVNEDFSAGIENVARDSQGGLNAAVFVRTAKLKDFPWNGSLRLGMDEPAKAAWNPVAGFTDAAGRLIWSTVGDPALIPFPFNASWIPNRVDFTVSRSRGQSGGVRVPAAALRPQIGSGALRPVGEGTFASAKVVYNLLASPFGDGTEETVADSLYPIAFAYRWGARIDGGDPAYEPRLGTTLSLLRDRLVGLRPLRIDREVKVIAPGLEVVQTTPVLEVYLRDAPGDEHQMAVLVPPWSSVPWHLLALMEEAVLRGLAAFSEEEAKRRKVPWLDLARDRSLLAKLKGVIREFEDTGYRPAALRDIVTADDARLRWRALRTFAEKNGHLLVTNGPYRLAEWSPGSVTLGAVRDVTYPLGFGAYDRYVHPPRAVLGEVTRESGRIAVHADVEQIVKVERHYETQRQPLTRKTSHGLFGLLVVSRYLLVGPDGTVVAADKMDWQKDGSFAVDLPDRMAPGRYALLMAIFLDGNSLLPSTKVLRLEIKD